MLLPRNLSAELIAKWKRANKPRKYKNERALGVDMHGKPHWYDSRAEHDYAGRLAFGVIAGRVVEWKPHPRIKMVLTGPVGTVTVLYVPDFYVRYADGDEVYVDVKGYLNPKDPATRLYRFKRDCAAAFGFKVVEERR